MGTPASIGMIHPVTGQVDTIRVNYDGYLEYMGNLLVEHYTDPKKIRDLLALGDISSLGETIDSTIAYCRDRQEEDQTVITYVNEDQYWLNAESYAYLYSADDVWYVIRHGRKITIEDALASGF
jgi:hypothetical protein